MPIPLVLDDILADLYARGSYVQPEVTSYTINNAGSVTIETGSTLVNPVLRWELAGEVPDTLRISNGGVNTDVTGTLERTITGTFTNNQTWVLTVIDLAPNGETKTTTASVSLKVQQKRYWGVSGSTSLDDVDILGLTSEFATSRAKSATTFDCTGGRYIYYAYPATFGEPTVMVGANIVSAWTNYVQPFINASGHEEIYNVIRFNNLQNGVIPVAFS